MVGASGLVGQELVRILVDRGFPFSDLKLYAADGTAGGRISTPRQAYQVQPLGHTAESQVFQETDIVFFTESDNTSRHRVPSAVQAGATVIDGSSIWRLEPDVPLVVPEINSLDIQVHRGIVSIHGCSTVLLNMVLYPLHKVIPVRRVIVSTYQSVSGLGQPAVDELVAQTNQIWPGSLPGRLFFHM